MPKIIGHSNRVVDHGGLTIDELVGNVATSCDRLSVALVKVADSVAEPWLTLSYDEWICVIKGKVVIEHAAGTMIVQGGETVLIEAGERFRPLFPEGDTEYIPVCIPAFRPDRCIREEEPGSKVTENLAKLHSQGVLPLPPSHTNSSDVIYHMCLKESWEGAKRDGRAYFPPTFEADGFFTHATAVPSRLIETANHFYQESIGDWLCLRISRAAHPRQSRGAQLRWPVA